MQCRDTCGLGPLGPRANGSSGVAEDGGTIVRNATRARGGVVFAESAGFRDGRRFRNNGSEHFKVRFAL